MNDTDWVGTCVSFECIFNRTIPVVLVEKDYSENMYLLRLYSNLKMLFPIVISMAA